MRRLIAIDSAKVPADNHFVRTLDIDWAAAYASHFHMGTLRLTWRGIVYAVCTTNRVKLRFAEAFDTLTIPALLSGLTVSNFLTSRCIHTGPIFADFVLRTETGDIITRKALAIITDLSIRARPLSIADAVDTWAVILDADAITGGEARIAIFLVVITTIFSFYQQDTRVAFTLKSCDRGRREQKRDTYLV